ncbi:MAG: alpha/beta hydrolase [Cytophagales bacterium]|nr:alpha/beta hydrolase [Cytophagales bacterium]
MMNKAKKILFWFIAILVLCYGALLVYMVTNETSFVFHPNYTTRDVKPPHDSLQLNYKSVETITEDGIKLKGWMIFTKDTINTFKWIIFFHGNAGNVSDMGYPERYARLNKIGANVICFDYRGYGASDGTPSEQGLYKDGVAVYNYLKSTQNVADSNIVLYGYSLGSGVATEMATRFPAKALILEGAYLSVPDVGQELYPFIPVNLVAQNKFDNKLKITKITKPVLFIHSPEDKQIPYAHGQKLYEMANEPKYFSKVSGGHIDAQLQDMFFYINIKKFLTDISFLQTAN